MDDKIIYNVNKTIHFLDKLSYIPAISFFI